MGSVLRSNCFAVLKLAMDVAVAIACSDVEHQNAMMGSEIPPRLLDCLETCESDIVRERAADCVIKLTYKDVLPCLGEDGEHADNRKMVLQFSHFQRVISVFSICSNWGLMRL